MDINSLYKTTYSSNFTIYSFINNLYTIYIIFLCIKHKIYSNEYFYSPKILICIFSKPKLCWPNKKEETILIENAKLIIYDNNKNSININLSQIQILAICKILGLKAENGNISYFSDNSLKTLMEKTIDRFKLI